MKLHICTFSQQKKIFVLCSLLNDWNHFWDKYCNLPFLAICRSLPPFNISCVILISKSKNWTANELAEQKMINYHIRGTYKTTCYKTKPNQTQVFPLSLTAAWMFFLYPYQSVGKFWKIDKISLASFHCT